MAEWQGSEQDIVPLNPNEHSPEQYSATQPQSTIQQDVRDLAVESLPMMGDIGGSLGGARIGASLGAPLGVPGMVLGGAMGAGVGAIGRYQLTDPEKRPPSLASDALKEMAISAGTSFVPEAFSYGKKALIEKMYTPDPVEKLKALDYTNINKVQNYAREAGTTLLPSQMLHFGPAVSAENFANSLIFGKKPIKTLLAEQEVFLRKEAQKFIGDVNHGNPLEASTTVAQWLKNNDDVLTKRADQEYRELDQAIQSFTKPQQVQRGYDGAGNPVFDTVQVPVTIPLTTVRDRAAKIVSETELESVPMFAKIAKGDANLTFSEAANLRSEIGTLKRKLDPKDWRVAELIKIDKQIENQMRQTALSSGSGRVWKKYEDVSKWYRESAAAVRNEAVQSMIQNNAFDTMTTMISQGKLGDIADIKRGIFFNEATRTEAGKAAAHNAWNKVQESYLSNIVKKYFDPQDQVFKGIGLAKDLADKKVQAQLKELLDSNKYKEFMKFADLAAAMSRDPKTAGVMASIIQASAIVGLTGGIITGATTGDWGAGAGASIVTGAASFGAFNLAAKSIAKMVTDPKFNSMLMGIKTAKTPAIRSVMTTKIIAHMTNMAINDPEKQQSSPMLPQAQREVPTSFSSVPSVQYHTRNLKMIEAELKKPLGMKQRAVLQQQWDEEMENLRRAQGAARSGQ